MGANSYVAQCNGTEADNTVESKNVVYGKSPMNALEQLKLNSQQTSQTYQGEGLLKKVDGKDSTGK